MYAGRPSAEYISGMELDLVIQVIWVIQVMFCFGSVGLSCFVKYLGLTWILHWIVYVLMLVSGSDQSEQLSVLDDNKSSASFEGWINWSYN